ncbi:DUF1934 domain-containing protein [Oceanobacillus piezotolerans]|uniref:DUF1934 domain-containing protein n=1 Tax=Oceanobacillus piezotolerans TaxID=2448030 RepID=A0A498DBK6_9BACI|nr:DUF1934 domain-containing protein [Oceanobacillus piezotolerans]RLL42857.1 DUF1934 domain-containing protein [Oceanobacillus piezotolerans]
MNPVQKRISLHLQTIIDDGENKEYNKVQEEGYFFQKGKLHVITYEEITEEKATIKNLITIQKDKVNIKRTGFVTMTQMFKPQQITENVYKHPHGSLHMETYTNQITYQSLAERNEGKLIISYTVKLNGQEERKHELVLVFKEEDSK